MAVTLCSNSPLTTVNSCLLAVAPSCFNRGLRQYTCSRQCVQDFRSNAKPGLPLCRKSD